MFSRYSLIATLALTLSAAALPSPTRRQSCADVMVIFARGTTETAPIGSPTSVGPVFESALATALGSKTLSFQGVTYPADIPGFLEGGDPTGSRNMANDLTSAANSCPNAKIVSSGYSQGGQLVHNSAKLISASVASRISAVVIFGDPDDGQAVAQIPSSKVDVICHAGDNICEGGILVLPPHLNYQMDAPAAAQFVASHV